MEQSQGDRLAAYEACAARLRKRLALAREQVLKLKAEGRTRSAAFHQAMGEQFFLKEVLRDMPAETEEGT